MPHSPSSHEHLQHPSCKAHASLDVSMCRFMTQTSVLQIKNKKAGSKEPAQKYGPKKGVLQTPCNQVSSGWSFKARFDTRTTGNNPGVITKISNVITFTKSNGDSDNNVTLNTRFAARASAAPTCVQRSLEALLHGLL